MPHFTLTQQDTKALNANGFVYHHEKDEYWYCATRQCTGRVINRGGEIIEAPKGHTEDCRRLI
jgi:hypothetical protein